MAHNCNPSYLEGRAGEDPGPGPLGINTEPYLKNN
jgi:hypothetical protein